MTLPRTFISPNMQRLVEMASRVGRCANLSALIHGETGSGKEIIARIIYENSDRQSHPFVSINCASLPKDLIEAELFGATKGAYTGAICDRPGLFKHADGGTVFLDELSEMPIEQQTRLLRVLEENKVRPVGGIAEIDVDVRVIAALNKHPIECLRGGELREDLYYRLAEVTLTVPPLRERRADIRAIAEAYAEHYSKSVGRETPRLSPEAVKVLEEYNWPGNVRQLRNEIKRVVFLCPDAILTPQSFDLAPLENGNHSMLPPGISNMELIERNAIVTCMKKHDGNKLACAKDLGIGRQTLYNKLGSYGIRPQEYLQSFLSLPVTPAPEDRAGEV